MSVGLDVATSRSLSPSLYVVFLFSGVLWSCLFVRVYMYQVLDRHMSLWAPVLYVGYLLLCFMCVYSLRYLALSMYVQLSVHVSLSV